MPGVLFWNLYGRKKRNREARAGAICGALTRIVQHRELDVLVFCECSMPEENITLALNAAGVGTYHLPRSRSQRIKVWTRLPVGAIQDRYNGNGRAMDRLTIREVQFPNALPILLTSVHLPARQTLTRNDSRALNTVAFAERIQSIEAKCANDRTVLVGDLNMNPYEAGVTGAQAFHAVMTKELARAVGEMKSRKTHPCFYNPTWSAFGDVTPGPPGTHYWGSADDPANHFWQVYDQVLLRPAVMDEFVRAEILIAAGEESLLTSRGRPRTTSLSDHLPLLCEFQFTPRS